MIACALLLACSKLWCAQNAFIVSADYKQRIGALEKQLYQLNTKEFQLLRAILRLTAPESEQRADDETISVLSSLLEVPAAGDGREVSTRYSRPAAAHERYGDEEVMSELSSPRERVPSNQESIPEDDGYSSSFDEESAALVRHRQHHSPLHSVSYIADEHQSVSEESVSSAELEARDRELQSRQQDVWQRVMKHLVRHDMYFPPVYQLRVTVIPHMLAFWCGVRVYTEIPAESREAAAAGPRASNAGPRRSIPGLARASAHRRR